MDHRCLRPEGDPLDESQHALTLIGPDGSPTALGPRRRKQNELDSDAAGMFWDFNARLRFAPLGASAPTTGQATCPQTEVAVFPSRKVPRAKLLVVPSSRGALAIAREVQCARLP